tara:strand:+ start:108 stop:422 length:315 start_codon:yes stop_codon:yes gene_type:complete
MAKQIFELKLFHKGINTAVSGADGDENHTENSLNLDVRGKIGELTGVREDASINKNFPATDMVTIKDVNKGTILIGFFPLDQVNDFGIKLGQISVIENLYGDNS